MTYQPKYSSFSGTPTGRATLPIMQLAPSNILNGNNQVLPHQSSTRNLSISAWNLYQAAKKAELASSFNAAQIGHLAYCFAAEHHQMFRWNVGNLRLVDGVTDWYEMAARSRRSGPIGEGMLLLAMHTHGYVFWDRFDVLVKRAIRKQIIKHPNNVKCVSAVRRLLAKQKCRKRSDFAVETRNGSVALAEAKGSFVTPGNNPQIARDMRYALQQLTATAKLVLPQPKKLYAVGTYLREASDPHPDQSLVAMVDPEPEEDGQSTVELPQDWIRRGNYGAWLVGMGFPESGNALRHGIGVELPGRQMLVVEVGRRSFAITIEGVVRKRNRKIDDVHPRFWLDPFFFLEGPHFSDFTVQFLRDMGVAAIRVIGTELGTLRLIESSVQNSDSTSLLEKDARAGDIEPQTISDGFTGSIFPDGTLFGQIDLDMLIGARMEEFRL